MHRIIQINLNMINYDVNALALVEFKKQHGQIWGGNVRNL